MKKHFFFDMDGTLTHSTCEASMNMNKTIKSFLARGADVIVVSGARREKMIEQLGPMSEFVALLAQNGNHAEAASGSPMWKVEFTWWQKLMILQVIKDMDQSMLVTDYSDLAQDRGCQISYSLTGHTAPLDVKRNVDPDRKIRLKMLENMKGELAVLASNMINVAIGGTTCIDFYVYDKGHNVAKMIEYYGWDPKECVYIGDALFEGGNDYTVTGIIDTVPVEGPEECETFIKEATKLMPRADDIDDDDDEDEEEGQ